MYLLSDLNPSKEKQKANKTNLIFQKEEKIQFNWEQETMEKKFKQLNEKNKNIFLGSY